jgi:hypothetical protein
MVDATAGCILSLAPLGLEAVLNPLTAKGSAKEERLETLKEVRHAQPVGTVLRSNLDLCADSSLLHPLIDYAAAPLSPLLRFVSPSSCPFYFVTPRVPQLDEFVSFDLADVKDTVGMSKSNTHF